MHEGFYLLSILLHVLASMFKNGALPTDVDPKRAVLVAGAVAAVVVMLLAVVIVNWLKKPSKIIE